MSLPEWYKLPPDNLPVPQNPNGKYQCLTCNHRFTKPLMAKQLIDKRWMHNHGPCPKCGAMYYRWLNWKGWRP